MIMTGINFKFVLYTHHLEKFPSIYQYCFVRTINIDEIAIIHLEKNVSVR